MLVDRYDELLSLKVIFVNFALKFFVFESQCITRLDQCNYLTLLLVNVCL
jgi:hypothetical protein